MELGRAPAGRPKPGRRWPAFAAIALQSVDGMRAAVCSESC